MPLLVILLFASCCATLCSHVPRKFYLIQEVKTWDEAQSYCRKNYNDLATIGSHRDMKLLEETAVARGVDRGVWIGLKKGGVASWLWSVGETQTSHGLVEYTNWISSPHSSHHCGGMEDNGKWFSALCETELPFVCQRDEGSVEMHVVLERKSWRQAQTYCRLKNGDLASVRNEYDNHALQQILSEGGLSFSSFWIGLFRDDWKWSDQSDSSFRYWSDSQPNRDGNCALYSTSIKQWFDRSCFSSRHFYCHDVVKKVRRQIIRVEIKSDSLLNLNDSAVSDAVMNQIQKKYEGVNFQWKVQPDGKIFRKKEKEEMDETCENMT